jgi:hypothetical protein
MSKSISNSNYTNLLDTLYKLSNDNLESTENPPPSNGEGSLVSVDKLHDFEAVIEKELENRKIIMDPKYLPPAPPKLLGWSPNTTWMLKAKDMLLHAISYDKINQYGTAVLFRDRESSHSVFYIYKSNKYGTWIIGYEKNVLVYVSEPIV